MDATDSVWQGHEKQGTDGTTLSGGRVSLASFQFPKQKEKAPSSTKAFRMQHSIGGYACLPSRLIFSQNHAQAPVDPPRKTIYTVESWQAVACIVQRQANTLKEESSRVKRYKCLATLKDIFLEASIPESFYSKAFPFLLEPLLLCLSDPTETSRHMASCLLLKLLSEVTDVDGALEHVLRGLACRFGSIDIDGVAHLPPLMRPEPEYKPLQLTPIEKSDDVRQTLLQVLHVVLERCSDESVWGHLDLATGLLRAGAMDISPEIKSAALETLVEFCGRHQQMLLHFTEPLARAVLSCLVHQHAKIRMGALRALTHVLACGLYKYNGEIIQMLSGWRDPNFVPIKALYEPTTIRNYFAELLADRSPMVRMFFFDTMTRWLLKFKDKADYETWLFPFLLSGLFDPFRPIQQLVFTLLESLGKHYEGTHEKDLRDIKQLGTPELWSYEGKAYPGFPLGGYWKMGEGKCMDEEAEQFISFVGSYSERLHLLGFESYSPTVAQKDRYLAVGGALIGNPRRPCLGTRMMVRTYFRRYAKALFEPVEDFKEVTVKTSARLMVVSFAYMEEALVEWLDNCLTICARVLSAPQRHSADALEAYKVAMRLVGVFVDPENYWDFVKDAFEEHCFVEPHQQIAMLRLLALMLDGSFMVLQTASNAGLGLGRLSPVIPKIAEALARTHFLQEQSGSYATENVTQIVEILVSGVVQQKETLPVVTWHHLLNVICALARPANELSDDSDSLLDQHLQDLLDKLAKCNAAGSNKEPDPTRAGSMWFYAGISKSLPPANLAALSAYLRYLPCSRILEEEPFQQVLAQLQDLSAATQAPETRRGARRTALRLSRRLVLLDATDINQTHTSSPTTPAFNRPSLNHFVPQIVSNTHERPVPSKEQRPKVEDLDGRSERRKSTIKAAADILKCVIVSRLRELDSIDDLRDTLAALIEFLTLPQPTTPETRKTLHEILVISGLASPLGWLVSERCLHTKLFCLACEAYSHECASTYPNKSPAMVLDDMPLGKRRELRLSAIRAAAALKDHAVLLLRLSLEKVAQDLKTIRLIISSVIASMHPPDKLRKLSEARLSATPEELGPPEGPFGWSTEQKAVAGGEHWAPQCTWSLPFQVQSPWFIFQSASCLVDAILLGISCRIGVSSEGEFTQRPEDPLSDGLPPLLTMPRAWRLPAYSHHNLQAARQVLLELTTEAELCQAADTCIRHIVELQSASADSSQKSNEGLSEGSKGQAKASRNLKDVVKAAQRQRDGVPVAIQKEQAKIALIQVVRLLRNLCPSALDSCLREYEARGNFTRREHLSRILKELSPELVGFRESIASS